MNHDDGTNVYISMLVRRSLQGALSSISGVSITERLGVGKHQLTTFCKRHEFLMQDLTNPVINR
jgi:hypothetical protein